MNKSVAQLGFWSSVFVTLMLIAFPLSLIFGSLDVAYGLSFLLAPAFVTMMVSIHHYAAPEKKVWSHLGLSFGVIYTVMCSLTYYIQLTFIKNNYLPIADEAAAPFVFIPGTPIFAQDMLGYVFFCLATLAAGPVFTGGKLEAWTKWLFIFNGVLFAIPTLILPALTMPTNAAGTGVGNQVGEYANIVWSFYAAIAAGLTAIVFRRLKSTA
ncbi:MAG TPA: hypothetical protein VNK49_03940 [Anaerolineales bacterium]|nr:hypothetical protein [Anaerolineales bacterium]